MEVERVWETEEEDEIFEEVVVGGLEARKRKTNGASLQESGVVKGGTDEEKKSVYLDSDKGLWKCRCCNWTYPLSGPSRYSIPNHEGYCQMAVDLKSLAQIELFYDSPTKVVVLEAKPKDEVDVASETGLQNGTASSKNEGVKYQENGTSSELYSEDHAGKELSGNQYKTEGKKHITLMNKTKLNLEDYDLEKVLEEQETHDLYCPNCNSCITRRVILRKRKRTVKEFQCDLPAKKVQVQQEIGSSTVSTEMPEQRSDWERPDIFRCLSCFSIFIPTECGFNIFQIFGKKGKTPDPQNPTPISQGSQTNENEPVVQPPTQIPQSSQTNESKPGGTEEPSEEVQQGKPATPVQNHEMPALPLIKGWMVTYGEHKTDQPPNSKLIVADAVLGVPSTISNADIQVPGVSEMVQEPIIVHEGKVLVISDSISRAPVGDSAIDMPGSGINSIGVQVDGWDILKAMVYGGLFESITSLSIVSSAAAADASTLNVFVLGLANLVGGLFIIIHEIFELKRAQDEAGNTNDQRQGRYWALLGMRRNFWLHAMVAITTYILVGMVPPLIYGLSFRESDNKEYKLIAVAAASLVCITLLSIGKAHIRGGRKYITTVLYYLALGVQVSGLSYVAGMLIKVILDKLGLFDHSSAAPGTSEWASY